MKSIYSYYVTFVLGPYNPGPNFGFLYGQPIDFKKIIKSVNINLSTWRLEGIYHRWPTTEDGEYTIDESLIRKEVCQVLWEQEYAPKYKREEVSDEQFEKIKEMTINQFEEQIVILGWSETNLL